MRLSRRWARWISAATALASCAAHAELSGGLRLAVNAGVDTNARRDFNQSETTPVTDMVTSLIGSGLGRYQGERFQIAGSYDLGVRKFMRFPLEDVLIQSATLRSSLSFGKRWAAGVEGRVKDRRGGARDYSDLYGGGFLEFAPDARLALRIQGGGHRFLYTPDFQFAFKATELGFSGRYRLDKRHTLLAFGEAGWRAYQGAARVKEGDAPRRRSDSLLTAGVGYTFRGPVALTLTYAFTDQASTSVGLSATRHRVTATAGVRLPWELTLLGQGTLLFSSFPVNYPAGEILLLDDDEQHNALSLKLVRALSEQVDVELRYALYGNRLPHQNLSYLRQVAWVGLGWRL
ncbi:MAG: hypothetical protein ACT4TC_09390 [Myxococcaceae bacterium]